MSLVMKFDKINALDSNRRSEPYKEYFGKMSISDKQKETEDSFFRTNGRSYPLYFIADRNNDRKRIH